MTPALDTDTLRVPKVTMGDLIKIALLVFAMVAGWFRMESRIDSVSSKQTSSDENTRERVSRVEGEIKSNRDETREEFKEINRKLDRIIAGRK